MLFFYFEVFVCPKVEALLTVDEHCYQDIPVKVKDQPEEDLFINVNTRVLHH